MKTRALLQWANSCRIDRAKRRPQDDTFPRSTLFGNKQHGARARRVLRVRGRSRWRAARARARAVGLVATDRRRGRDCRGAALVRRPRDGDGAPEFQSSAKYFMYQHKDK